MFMMMQKSYYLDTCIWLNLFKKEGDPTKGIPYWKIAKEFIKFIEKSDNSIIVSTIILKELSFKLPEKFDFIMEFFDKSSYIKLIKTTPEDYNFARELESNSNFEISFYDCLHIAISKRLNMILVTRDNELLNFADKYIEVKKPEELFN